MVDYVHAAATALRLIKKNGKPITLVKLATTASDPTKPWRGPVDQRSPPAASLNLFGAEISFSKRQLGVAFTKKSIPDTVTGYFFVAVPPGTQDLTKFDELTSDGVVYKIEVADVLRPGTVDVLYLFGISK